MQDPTSSTIENAYTDFRIEHFKQLEESIEKASKTATVSAIRLHFKGQTDARAIGLLASLSTELRIEENITLIPSFSNQEEQATYKNALAYIDEETKETSPNKPILGYIGESTITFIKDVDQTLRFIQQVLTLLFSTITNPKTFRVKETISQIDQTGYQAIGITILINLLIGIVITYLMGNQLSYYGANILAVDGITITTCRELSPILVAIIVAGRSGSAFAAQIGSMRLNKEVEALHVMGLNPISILVLPRVIGLIIVMPLLVLIGDIAGIIGGLFIANVHLDVHPNNFVERLMQVLEIRHVLVGIAKAPLFALFISTIGCYLGLAAQPNATSIGKNTTKAVVQGITSVIILNAVIAVALSYAEV